MNLTTSETELSTSEKAVLHIVRRVQSDASFAWLMIGTESLSLCFDAIAERRSEPVESVRARIEENAASNRETPEVVKLRKSVRDLTAQLHNEEAESSAWRKDATRIQSRKERDLSAIDELIWQVEFCGQALTIEDLKKARGKA